MNRAVGIGVLVIIALALAVLFPRYFQRVTERVYVGYKGEAAHNHHLAAQRFLQQKGFDAQKLRRLGQLEQLDSDAMLFWSRVPSEGERTRLLDWVSRGGHLLLDTPQSQEALLKDIGVKHYWPDEPRKDADDTTPSRRTGTEKAKPKRAAGAATLVCSEGRVSCSEPRLVVAGQQEFMLEIDFGARLTQSEEQAQSQFLRSAWDDYGYVMLERAFGRGRITVLANDRHFYNELIGDHDHAAWLSFVVGAQQRQVWFADVPLAASLWDWLREHAWPVLLAAAIVIVLGLWRAVTRFGPLLPGQAPGRLSFRDHLVACGRFHWRHAAAHHLLHNVEQEAQRLELGAKAPPPRQATGRPGGRAADAPAFVQAVKTMQQRLHAVREKSRAARNQRKTG